MLPFSALQMEVCHSLLIRDDITHKFSGGKPGLLCVTCTDLSVLATNNYPEKWWVPELNASRRPLLKPNRSYSNYGGVSAKAEYSHEVVSWRTRPYLRVMMGIFEALRLVLHTISTSAARYGRYIQPLLSLSIDFYVRLFVRVQTAPIEVKKLARFVDKNLQSSPLLHLCPQPNIRLLRLLWLSVLPRTAARSNDRKGQRSQRQHQRLVQNARWPAGA